MGTPSPGAPAKAQATLPWATLTEKTMAAGPLEIYRVPGSVSFLHSGALLHTIMPRSNCWCVDGVSKFAMRVLPDTYYRIELPGETPEDLEKVEELKVTLAKVLYYERTACPFARTFSVHLPEEEEVKPKKRRRRTDGPAKKWKLDRAYSWKPEGWTPDQHGPNDESSGSHTPTDEEGSSSSSSTEDQVEEAAELVKEMRVTTPSRPSVRDRAKGFNLRSVTAPPQVFLQSTPPSRLRTSLIADDSASISGRSQGTSRSHSRNRELQTEAGASHGQQRTLQTIPTDMPPSPPDSSTGFETASPNRPLWTAFPEHASSSDNRQVDRVAQHSHVSDHLGTTISALTTSSSREGDQGSAAASRPATACDQLEENPGDPDEEDEEYDEAECTSLSPEPHDLRADTPASSRKHHGEFVKGHLVVVIDAKSTTDSIPMLAQHEAHAPPLQDLFGDRTNIRPASLPKTQFDGADLDQIDKHPSLQVHEGSDADIQDTSVIYTEQPPDTEPEAETDCLHSDSAVNDADAQAEPDPYAQIQARIQARRNIGVTTGFEPHRRQTTRQSSSSTASSSSRRSIRTRRGRPSDLMQDQALAAGLVRKAYDTFLGPPAHLIAIMLKIAARFAKGTFRNTLLYESPPGMKKRIPGSFDLDASDLEDFESEDDELEGSGEDDFGVPLRSPVRMMSSEAVPRQLASPSIKEIKAWQVET